MAASQETLYTYENRTYRIWNQGLLGDEYMARHGCSWCALATMIGALKDPDITPLALRKNAGMLLQSGSGHALYSPLQLALQRKPVTELFRWSDFMPLNIAGAVRILECYTKTDYLDGPDDETLRSFLLTKAGLGLPVIATGRNIPSESGTALCTRATHTFLIIGQRDERTLITADSSASNDERIKYVDIDDLVNGIFRTGITRGLKARQYYYYPGARGGVAAPAQAF